MPESVVVTPACRTVAVPSPSILLSVFIVAGEDVRARFHHGREWQRRERFIGRACDTISDSGATTLQRYPWAHESIRRPRTSRIAFVSNEPTRRIAIVVPADLLTTIDRVAHDLGESRSRYMTRILRCAVRARRRAVVTRRLDELFTNPVFATEQRRAVEDLDAAGSSWDDEQW
jgi:hypothetical protein